MAKSRWAIVCLSALYAGFLVVRAPADPIRAPDTIAYLGFSPAVPAGYPAFLAMVTPKGAEISQPILYAAAVAWIGLEALALTSSVGLALSVWLASVVIPQLSTYHVSLLSESLFMSLSAAFLASAVRFVRHPSERGAVLMGALAGVAATVRAPGHALAVVVAIAVLMEWRRLPSSRRLWTLAAPLVVIAIIAVAERAVSGAVHRSELTSLVGRSLFAKAALIDSPRMPDAEDPLRRRLDDILEHRFEPARRTIDRESSDLRRVLQLFYETCVQGPCAEDLGHAPWTRRWYNDVVFERAGARIARAPLAYFGLTMDEYRSLWIPLRLHHPETSRQMRAFLAADHPIAFRHEALSLSPQDTQPYEVLRLVQPVVTLVAWGTGLLMVCGVLAAMLRRPLPPALAVGALAASMAHGGLLITALFAAGIGRYALSYWPTVAVATCFGVFGLARLVASLVPSKRLPAPLPGQGTRRPVAETSEVQAYLRVDRIHS
jgi:hypothetical protein